MDSNANAYYNRHVETEWLRLTQPKCANEFASTLFLIDHYFPKSGKIIDIGCGPGRYSIELSKRGYAITLVEPAENELTFARNQFQKEGIQAETFINADARELSMFKDGSFNAALLLGSQYHLIDKAERIKALKELKRILATDGVAIIAYLNSWGLIRTGVTDFPHRFRDPTFLKSMLGELSFPEMAGFTTCHWSTPTAASQELMSAGFQIISYASAEGVAAGMQPLIEKLAVKDEVAYQSFLNFAAETCELPQFRDMAVHLLYVVCKQLKGSEQNGAL
jgi:ubiquinone/menaquinone biosynthesis C-methylase UbiE